MHTMAIQNRISRVMGERRLNIQELSRRSGLSYTTVWSLYHGTAQRIDLTTLDKLCRALDVQVGDLLEYVPDDAGRLTIALP
jgi:putative transcriptional regulator